jgi:hypothetical protein
MLVNPSFTATLKGGDKVFYIADERIHGINWQTIAGTP